jgi:hypothetical protein
MVQLDLGSYSMKTEAGTSPIFRCTAEIHSMIPDKRFRMTAVRRDCVPQVQLNLVRKQRNL